MKTLLTILLVSLMLGACSEQKSDMPAEVKELSFAELPFERQHARIVHDTEAAKKGLAAKGEYNCCVMPTCNWCLINDKHCGCAPHLNEGKAVCGECGQSWAIGRGILPGVEADDVKWGPGAVHEHEENHED